MSLLATRHFQKLNPLSGDGFKKIENLEFLK